MSDKRRIKKKEVNYLLSLEPEDVTLSEMKELFAATESSDKKFNTNDTFTLPEGALGNEEAVKTTVGRYVFNLLVLYPDLIEHTEYINHPMDKWAIGDLNNELGRLLLEDKIESDQYIDYLNKIQWLGFSTNNFLVPSLTEDLLTPLDSVKEKKKELLDAHKEEIENGDIAVITKIEDQLLEMARDELEGIPAFEIYSSGCRGSYENNYKNTSIMRGAIADTANPGEYNISTSNLVEGIEKDEYEWYADIVVAASYSRAVQTREGGYEGKKLSAAFQTTKLGDEGSDCGTDKTIDIELTDSNKDMFLYRYIHSGGSKVLLDSENIDDYVGQLLHVRSPMYCTNDEICNYCAGDLYYKLDIKNIGLLSFRVGTSILNHALKSFHDLTVSVTEIDIENYID